MNTITTTLVLLADVQADPASRHRDLGDLRDLAKSIRTYGVMQPVVLERNGDSLRVVAGHRRVAAARLAGLEKIPALVHIEPLEDEEWLKGAVQENYLRRPLSRHERDETVKALTGLGYSREGIAEIFGVSIWTVSKWRHPRRATTATGTTAASGAAR